ncbi:probable methyltransferase-like protein 24 [Corythoichthys intestinalis]|uniref:probable methyltransferase-like protein 24 n=1 Tax=Corythoichthys intestinalis TaxID=161448 RepID=UPI0025A53BF2|nr:probable methyltransferase-like protein 24 [Corythoichthys intestinalis]XP_061808802.1 probable methyltransferase-like protein 24 [Nerophis lumbriciformis]
MCLVIIRFLYPGGLWDELGEGKKREWGRSQLGLPSRCPLEQSTSGEDANRRAMWRWRCREVALLLLPPLLLLVVFLRRTPGSAKTINKEPEAAVALSVMSIEPERGSARERLERAASLMPVPQEVEGPRGYEDENEINWSKVGPRPLELQPWAKDQPSFSGELDRIILYVNTIQLNCSRVVCAGQVKVTHPPAESPSWLLCAEEWLLPLADTMCVAYSFSMDSRDADFFKTTSSFGCDVHRFDPADASGSRRGNTLVGRHEDTGTFSRHRMWLEWQSPARKTRARRRAGASRTLADIMAELGHATVHFLYADLLSAEWRVFQNWIEAGTLQRVHHVVARVHLEWAGFQVGGAEEQVLRYWFTVLRGLGDTGLRLVHSSRGDGQRVLKRYVENARSSYTLSWVNTRR